MSVNRSTSLLLVLLCSAALAKEGVSEKLAAQTRFNIPAQPLSVSLKQLADQAGIQILFEEQVVSGLDAPALRLEKSALQALNILLSNTGLEFTARDETVAVRKKSMMTSFSTDVERVSPQATGEDSAASIRLARAEQQTVVPSKEGTTDENPSDDEAASGNASKEALEAGKRAIPEVLVEGSRSMNADIRRSLDGVLPLEV